MAVVNREEKWLSAAKAMAKRRGSRAYCPREPDQQAKGTDEDCLPWRRRVDQVSGSSPRFEPKHQGRKNHGPTTDVETKRFRMLCIPFMEHGAMNPPGTEGHLED